MRRENHRIAGRHIGQFINKNRAFRLQVFDHEFVVYNFVAHINRRAKFFDRALDNGNGAIHAGAKTARRGQHDLFAHERSSL